MPQPFEKIFSSPGAEYRGMPFWSWNGRLEPEKLRRQIREFKAMGLGGFFMHSRVGLATPYLGREWFECIRASIDEAKSQRLIPCLYDEDRWASGAAGGMVTRDPACRAWILYLHAHSGAAHPTSFGFWSARLDGAVARNLHRGDPEPGETRFEIFAEEEPCSAWFNGYTYLDVLNPEAVKRFIEVTYERYRQELGTDFGRAVPAIFTDEPHYWRYANLVPLPWPGAADAAWTPRLPELFRERFGYDLAEHLPELFYDCPERSSSPARYHYWQLLTELFVNAFTKQLGTWCEKNGIALTGHLLWEDTPSSQTRCVGASMRHYPYMQIPGIDQLTEYGQLYDACKQLASAARQFDRPLRISEVYGCTGWDMSFAGYKAMGDWQYALGVNRRCLHLSFYTMEGEAKRDYPASFSPHSSFSGVLKFLEDYFARLGVVLSRGREVRDLLVVHPVESAWTLLNRDLVAAQAFDRKLATLRNGLFDRSLDFDYGDEEHLARFGSVEPGARLKLASGVYRAVLLPEMETIRGTTLTLLRRFRESGGVVCALGNAPARVDGMPDPAAREFWRDLPRGVDALEPLVRRVRLTAQDGTPVPGMLHQLRESADGLDLFLCNPGFESEVPDEHRIRCAERRRELLFVAVELRTSRSGSLYELVPESGKILRHPVEKIPGGCRWTTSFHALQSRIFHFSDREISGAKTPKPFQIDSRMELSPSEWKIRRDEPNVLVLDRAAWKLGEGRRHEPDFILRIDDEVRRALGVPVRGGRMVQPWARKVEKAEKAPLELEYRFHVSALPDGALFLALERPDEWQIELNGMPVESRSDEGFWIDDAIRRLRLPPDALRTGCNHLRLFQEYRTDGAGLEAFYLLGEFCVTGESLTPLRRTLQLGDWCTQGFPNYAGNMVYCTTFDWTEQSSGRLRLRLGRHGSTAIRVRFNGRDAGILGWAPWELELEQPVRGGNTLEIEVIGSRRNALGPFFLADPHPLRFGANEFREYSHPEYRNLTSYGLFTPPELLWERECGNDARQAVFSMESIDKEGGRHWTR